MFSDEWLRVEWQAMANPIRKYLDAFFFSSEKIVSRVDLFGSIVSAGWEPESSHGNFAERFVVNLPYAKSFVQQVRGIMLVTFAGVSVHVILMALSVCVLDGPVFGIYWSAYVEMIVFIAFASVAIHTFLMLLVMSRYSICIKFDCLSCVESTVVPTVGSSAFFKLCKTRSHELCIANRWLTIAFPLVTNTEFLVEGLSVEVGELNVVQVKISQAHPRRTRGDNGDSVIVSMAATGRG